MKIILIAPLVSHATMGRIAALTSTNNDVVLIDVSSRKFKSEKNFYPVINLKKIYNLNISKLDSFFSSEVSYFDRLKDILRSYSIIKENKKINQRLTKILEIEKPNFVFFFYGPVAIHFFRLIKKIDQNIKTILIPNLLPSTIIKGNFFLKFLKKSVSNEFINYNNWINKVDIIFAASDEMKYFINKKFNFSLSSVHVIPDFHPKSFFVANNIIDKKIIKENSLIFLGAPERWGGRIDNIDYELHQIIDSKIELVVNDKVKSKSKLNCEVYDYFSDYEVFTGKLSNAVNSNAVALVTYNIDKISERFKSTLPTRFFTALSAGLIIAVKSGHFSAVKSFVEKYKIGFIYTGVNDLKQQLNNKDKLQKYHKNVYQNLHKFTAESQAEKIKLILKKVSEK